MAGVVNMGGDELPAGGGGHPAPAPASGMQVEEVRAVSKEVAEQFRTLVNAEEFTYENRLRENVVATGGNTLHLCSLFANQAGLDMLEMTLIALQGITLEKILDDAGRKMLCATDMDTVHTTQVHELSRLGGGSAVLSKDATKGSKMVERLIRG